LADRVLEQAPDLAEKVERGELTLPQARTELARREKRKELAEKARQVKRIGFATQIAMTITKLCKRHTLRCSALLF